MKNKVTLLLSGALFFMLLTAMKMPANSVGGADLQMDVFRMEDQRVQLRAQNLTGKKLQVSLWMQETNTYSHQTETEIYSEQFSGDLTEINRTLNLSKLEKGNYRLSIKAGKKQVDRMLDIRAKPTVDPNDSRIILFQQ